MMGLPASGKRGGHYFLRLDTAIRDPLRHLCAFASSREPTCFTARADARNGLTQRREGAEVDPGSSPG
jgi:hypothetical protein